MAGLAITGEAINITVGDISRAIVHHMNRAIAFKRFTDRLTAADLASQFGISLADANMIKSAITELAQINATFQVNRAFIDQVSGLGDV